MDAANSDRKRDVGARVDQQDSSQFPVLGFQSRDDVCGFAGERFQIARGQIFFAELDIVDVGAGGLGDFLQELVAAGWFIAIEGAAIGDVVEETVWHARSAVPTGPVFLCRDIPSAEALGYFRSAVMRLTPT